jgi:hypothetical protein
MLPSASRVPITVIVMLSWRSEVEPAKFFETCTVLPNVTLTSQEVPVIVSEVFVRSVMAPATTALVPGEGEGAPGLGHAAPKPPPPPVPRPLRGGQGGRL